jgi:hypothetical protein
VHLGAVPLLQARDPLSGERGDRLRAGLLGEEAQGLRGDIVVLRREAGSIPGPRDVPGDVGACRSTRTLARFGRAEPDVAAGLQGVEVIDDRVKHQVTGLRVMSARGPAGSPLQCRGPPRRPVRDALGGAVRDGRGKHNMDLT